MIHDHEAKVHLFSLKKTTGDRKFRNNDRRAIKLLDFIWKATVDHRISASIYSDKETIEDHEDRA